MDFAPVPVRFMRSVVIEGKRHAAGDVATFEHALASALIDAQYACPLGGEPEPSSIRGRFVTRPRP